MELRANVPAARRPVDEAGAAATQEAAAQVSTIATEIITGMRHGAIEAVCTGRKSTSATARHNVSTLKGPDRSVTLTVLAASDTEGWVVFFLWGNQKFERDQRLLL